MKLEALHNYSRQTGAEGRPSYATVRRTKYTDVCAHVNRSRKVRVGSEVVHRDIGRIAGDVSPVAAGIGGPIYMTLAVEYGVTGESNIRGLSSSRIGDHHRVIRRGHHEHAGVVVGAVVHQDDAAMQLGFQRADKLAARADRAVEIAMKHCAGGEDALAVAQQVAAVEFQAAAK